jgi:glycosyltransferase involved in cell wall biosynthesis
MSLISVVIPAFNASGFIAETIGSACRQTHRDLDIVVVDDGSTDDTAQIVRGLAASDPRIRLIEADHRGVSAARNRGIAEARSALIATLDADDLWHPRKIERQYDLLRRSAPDVGVVYCWAAGIDAQGRVILPVWNASQAEGDVLSDIVRSGILSNGSTPLMRREAIERAGGYDENLQLCEDWQFYTALAGVCRFRAIPECLTGYRITDTSTSMDVLPMERAIAQVTVWIKTTWPDLPETVLLDRARNVHRYLAFLAIRGGQYGLAARYLWRGVNDGPGFGLNFQMVEMAALLLGHAFGIRQYRWQFWRKPQPFLQHI